RASRPGNLPQFVGAAVTSALLFSLIGSFSFSQQKLTTTGRVLWVRSGDFNGDGGADLLVVLRRGYGLSTKRFLAWYLQRPDRSFADKPDEEREVPADAAFAAIADVDGDNRDEVVLIGANGVNAYGFREGGISLEELLRAPTATPFPENEDL